MTRNAMFALTAAPIVAIASSTLAGAIPSPYVIDFFPDSTQINNTIQLVFFGPGNAPNAAVGYEITNVRLNIEFTTASTFQAENLLINLIANSGTTFISVSGADLGWSGQGTFNSDVNFTDLNGIIGPGLWSFEVQSVDPVGPGPIFAYSGSFSSDTRFEVSLIPAPGTFALIGGAAAVGLRRRRR